APPELSQDLILQGIHLVGGGGLLKGFDVRLAQTADLPVHLVQAPLECVVLGAGRCLDSFDSLKAMFVGAAR
ncbi:MAG: rod shape-determining protein, partial [Candidatus Dormibacteria bacterium]